MSRQPRPRPLARFIYVIGPQQGLQKVGLATDPQARLAALQTASPFDLITHAAVAVPFREAHAVERHAHRLLARSRVRNEWFETTPAEAVAAVHSASTPFAGRTTRVPDPAVIWQPSSSWRISRAPQPPALPPDTEPLMAFAGPGQTPVSDQAAHGLPLFEFTRPAAVAVPGFAPDTPLDTLRGYRLEIQCCGPTTSYPVGLLASSLPHGGRTPLAAAIGQTRDIRAMNRNELLAGRCRCNGGPALAGGLQREALRSR